MSLPEPEKTTSVSKTNGESGPASKAPFSPRISQTLESLEKQSAAVNLTATKIVNSALKSFERTLTEKLTSIANTSSLAAEVAMQDGISSMKRHQDGTWKVLQDQQKGIWTEMGRIQKSLTTIDQHLASHTNTIPDVIRRTWAPIVISAVIGLLIIGLSWFMRPGMPSSLIEVPGRNGAKYLIVTDPEWEICTVQGKNRPCKRR